MSRVDIKMPDLSTTDTQVKLLRWLVSVGQEVKRGQSLAEVETDKATVELESIAAGTIEELRVAPEQLVDVGQIVAVIQIARKP